MHFKIIKRIYWVHHIRYRSESFKILIRQVSIQNPPKLALLPSPYTTDTNNFGASLFSIPKIDKYFCVVELGQRQFELIGP